MKRDPLCLALLNSSSSSAKNTKYMMKLMRIASLFAMLIYFNLDPSNGRMIVHLLNTIDKTNKFNEF